MTDPFLLCVADPEDDLCEAGECDREGEGEGEWDGFGDGEACRATVSVSVSAGWNTPGVSVEVFTVKEYRCPAVADFGIMNAAFIVGSALPASAELKTQPPLLPRVAGDGHTGIVGTGPPVAGGLKLTARFFTGGEEGVPDGDAVARLATQTSMV